MLSYCYSADEEAFSLTDVIWISPFEAHLQIMVGQNRVIQFLQQFIALVFVQLVDVFGECSNGINALPAGHRIGSDDRMNDRQMAAYVLRRPSRLFVQCGLSRIRCFDEPIPNKRRRQAFEQLLVRLTKTIVDVIAGGPQCIAPSLG